MQGTFEKIHFQGLLGQQPFELLDFFSVRSRVRARTRSFFSWLDRFEFCAPLVEALRSYPQFSRSLTDVFASSHPLDRPPLKFPGVSLSLLCASFSGNCAQFCVSLQGFTPSRS